MGFVFAIIASFLHSIVDAIRKKLTQNSNEYLAYWGLTLFSVPVFLISIIFTGWPKLTLTFYLIIPVALLLNIVSFLMLFKALKISPLSLTIPFLAFTPVFLILTSYLMLRELPNFYGIFGIIFITLGAYILNISKIKEGFWGPIKAIGREKGSLYVLIVAFLWSILSNIDKIGLRNSSPTAYLLILEILVRLF